MTGVEEASDLGSVLPHEHLLLDFQKAFKEAEYGMNKDLKDLTFELKNLGKIRQFPYVASKFMYNPSHYVNLVPV